MCRLIIVLIDNCADQRGLERAAAAIPVIDHCAKIAQKNETLESRTKNGRNKIVHTQKHTETFQTCVV